MSQEQENSYTMITALIHDKSISPECRWLIIYILTNKEGSEIKTSQIVEHLKGQAGKDRIYRILKEACNAGYIKLVKIRTREGNFEHTKYKLDLKAIGDIGVTRNNYKI